MTSHLILVKFSHYKNIEASEMTNIDHEERVYRIKSLDKALTILECFSYQKKELNLSELAEQTGKSIRLQTESLYLQDQFDVVLM